MLQNPCKTLGFKKNMVYEIPPGGGGKSYPASGLLPFICKHKETLVKTIRCNLTKTSRIFATFTESFYKYMGILPSKFQEISPIYRRTIRSSISLVCSKH